MHHDGHPLVTTYRWARRIALALAGFTVLAVGIAMILLPGPGIVVILVGLGILSIEFAWAQRWLRKLKQGGATLVESIRDDSRDPQ